MKLENDNGEFECVYFGQVLQNAVVGMCGLCEAGVLCSVVNGWGLQKMGWYY